MSRFFLNALDPDECAVEAPEPGKWANDRVSGEFLDRYAQSIQIQGKLKDTHVAHSVPSVFARPIQFWQALDNARHPLHKAVVSEWRGFLALFALQKLAGLTLVVKPYVVPLPEKKAKKAEAEPRLAETATEDKPDRYLVTILQNQLPYPMTDWNRWWLIYCNDALVGATSPWTIFYTAARYRCAAAIPWQDERHLLKDPIEFYDPEKTRNPSYELTVLKRWVDLVLDGAIWRMPKNLEKQAGAIKRELQAWQKELRHYEKPAVKVLTLAGNPLIAEGAYRHFTQPPEVDVDAGPSSDLLIDARDSGEETVVLTRTGLEATRRVWNSVFASQVDFKKLKGPSGPKDWLATTGVKVERPYLIAEEAFLPPKLVELKLSAHALERGSKDFALPLTPEFFRYVGFETLLKQPQMLTVSVTTDSVVVRLKVPLKHGGELRVEKTYDRKSDVVALKGPTPAMAIWPDFAAGDWKHNFAAYAGGDDLAVAPLFVGKVSEHHSRAGEEMLRIWECQENVPIGFALYQRYLAPGSTLQQEHPVGVVLRAKMDPPPAPNGAITWEVAVDFGTSNTHVKARKGATGVVPLRMEGRMRLLTDAEASMKAEVTERLYRDVAIDPPFVTLLAPRRAKIMGPLRAPTDLAPRFLFTPDETEYLSDVKWSTGSGAADLPLKDFLYSVVRMAVAEARSHGVGKLTLGWAFPLAMPEETRGGMSTFWASVPAGYSSSGFAVEVKEGIPESDAACRCLAKAEPAQLPVLADALSIAIDVGGGSTDVGFWSAHELLDQVSLKLAGNDLLPRFWDLPGFVPELYLVCTGSPWDPVFGERFASRPAALINGALTAAQAVGGGNPHAHPFVRHLYKMPYGDPPWVHIRTLTYLFFSGLAFYTGLHARRFQTPLKGVHIYFGGRGSSLLAWVGSAMQIRQFLDQAFREGYLRDAPQNKDVPVTICGLAVNPAGALMPKEEVVRGLLESWTWESVKAAAENKTIVGEEGWCDKQNNPIDWHAELSPTQLLDLQAPPNFLSGYVAHFTMYFKDEKNNARKVLNLDEAHLKNLELRDGARVQQYVRFAAADPSRMVLQPVFACELRDLMEQYVASVLGRTA